MQDTSLLHVWHTTAATLENKFMWMHICMILLRGPLKFFTWSFHEAVDKIKSQLLLRASFFPYLWLVALLRYQRCGVTILPQCRTFEVSPTSSSPESGAGMCDDYWSAEFSVAFNATHLKCPKYHKENADESSPLCAVWEIMR